MKISRILTTTIRDSRVNIINSRNLRIEIRVCDIEGG